MASHLDVHDDVTQIFALHLHHLMSVEGVVSPLANQSIVFTLTVSTGSACSLIEVTSSDPGANQARHMAIWVISFLLDPAGVDEYTTSGMVMDVSAMLVARIIRRTPRGGGLKTSLCSAAGMLE